MKTETPLPFRIDRSARTITLPDVDPESFDPAAAIDLKDACKLMRGRTITKFDAAGREVSQKRHVALTVARRWANPRRGWKIELEDGHHYALVLPAAKLSGQLLTMAAWVLAFETARARLSMSIATATQRAGR